MSAAAAAHADAFLTEPSASFVVAPLTVLLAGLRAGRGLRLGRAYRGARPVDGLSSSGTIGRLVSGNWRGGLTGWGTVVPPRAERRVARHRSDARTI
jgi:hypothetical protein